MNWNRKAKRICSSSSSSREKTILFVTDYIVVWVISVPLLKSQLFVIVIVSDVHDVVFAVDFICRDRRHSFFSLSNECKHRLTPQRVQVNDGATSHESDWDLQQLLKITSQIKRNASFYFWPQNHQRKVSETKIRKITHIEEKKTTKRRNSPAPKESSAFEIQ